jgi:L-2-hydroxycarboxylate dehydrogenase (NAD+)
MHIHKQGPSYVLIDGQENFGYLVAYRCAQIASEKAHNTGIGIAGGFNTGHCGMLGYFPSMIAGRGKVAMAMCDTSPRIVPTGGVLPVLGTNPISAAFPAQRGHVLIDFSTAAITNGEILLALKDGRTIPEGRALDSNGHPTTDPEQARTGGVLSFGGHKGYALSVMIQMFSGILVNAATVPEPGTNYGIFMLAISPDIFLESGVFQEGVDELVSRLKSAKPSQEAGEILVPGERAFREREKRLKEGIEVDSVLMEELNQL